MAAADFVGFQTMRAATRDTAERYLGAVNSIVEAAGYLGSTFGKPLLLYDLALSSYPEPAYLEHQAEVLRQLFEHLPALERAGVVGVICRSLTSNPTMDTANYYGEAERHWGLRRADGSPKPALQVWIDGVRSNRVQSGSLGSETRALLLSRTDRAAPEAIPGAFEGPTAA